MGAAGVDRAHDPSMKIRRKVQSMVNVTVPGGAKDVCLHVASPARRVQNYRLSVSR
jgi:hypothetical protein